MADQTTAYTDGGLSLANRVTAGSFNAFNRVTYGCATIAALRAIATPDGPVTVAVRGYDTAGDGCGGFWWWNSTDTSTDNGGTVIKPTAVATLAAGRWNLVTYGGVLPAAQFGVKGDSTTDMTTRLQAWLAALAAIGIGAVGVLPATPGNYIKHTATLNVPAFNGVKIYGAGVRATRTRLVKDGAANTDAWSSNNVWASRVNGVELLDFTIEASGTASRYGLSYIAFNNGRLRLRIEGFTNTNGAGLYTEDSLGCTADLELSGNYYGWLDTGGANSPVNGWDCLLSVENNTNIGISIYGAFGCNFEIRACETNTNGGIDLHTAGGGHKIFGYLGELNGNFDIRLGNGSYINGIIVQGYFDIGTNYAIQVKFVTDLQTGPCYLANRTTFLEFLSDGNAINCLFGLLSLGVSASPVRNPATTGVTYKGIDVSILQRGNIFADYNTFPCGDANLVAGDFPYGGWTFTTSGTSTLTRSPNTGAAPDVFNGRPVGLITCANGDSNSMAQSWTIGAVSNPEFRDAWVTFELEVFYNNVASLGFTQTLDDTGTQVYALNQAGVNTAKPAKIYISGYFTSATTAIRALLNNFNNPASFKVGPARVCVGMDPRRFASLSGPAVFTGAAAIPTAGTFVVGDRIVRTPVVGQPKAWSCTVAGTPGTLTSEGNL